MKKLIIATTLLASIGETALAGKSAAEFGAKDPHGWMMAILSMGVVFSALIILFICFKYGYTGIAALGLKLKKGAHRKQQLETITTKRSAMRMTEKATGEEVVDEELAAAIGLALFMHEDGMHDQESDVLTLVQTTSGWTGAGQNHKRLPHRKF